MNCDSRVEFREMGRNPFSEQTVNPFTWERNCWEQWPGELVTKVCAWF